MDTRKSDKYVWQIWASWGPPHILFIVLCCMVIVVFLCSPEGFSIFSVVDCVIFNIRRWFWSTPSSSDTLFFSHGWIIFLSVYAIWLMVKWRGSVGSFLSAVLTPIVSQQLLERKKWACLHQTTSRTWSWLSWMFIDAKLVRLQWTWMTHTVCLLIFNCR